MRLLLALLLLLAPVSQAAVTFISGSSRTSLTGDISVPSGSDRAFTLFYSAEYSTAPTTVTATLGGNSLTAATGSPATVQPGGTGNAVWAFYLLEANFPANGTQALVVSVTGGADLQGTLVGWTFLGGASQSAPSYSELNESGGTDMSIGSFSVTSGGAAVAALTEGGSGATYTESANWVEVWDTDAAGGDAYGAGAYRLYVADGSDTVVFTRGSGSAGRACGSAMIFAAAGGGGPTSPPSGILLRGGGR